MIFKIHQILIRTRKHNIELNITFINNVPEWCTEQTDEFKLSKTFSACREYSFKLTFFSGLRVKKSFIFNDIKITRKCKIWHSIQGKFWILVIFANFIKYRHFGNPNRHPNIYERLCFITTGQLGTNMTVFEVVIFWSKIKLFVSDVNHSFFWRVNLLTILSYAKITRFQRENKKILNFSDGRTWA